MRPTVAFIVVAAVAGCSGQPKLATPPIAAAKPSAPVVNSPATAVNRSLVSQGYRPTTYEGQQLYCRMEKLTGSQFSHKVCLTEEEARLQERRAQDEMNRRGSQGKCMPPLCGD
jgi:hypothetical protein